MDLYRIDRHDFEELNSHVHLTLHEITEVSFEVKEINKHSFNRIYIVIADNGNLGILKNTLQPEQIFKMKTGYIYFIPCNAELDYHFKKGLSFISLHFNLELFGAYDIFNNTKDFLVVKDTECFGNKISQIIHSGKDIASMFSLNGLLHTIIAKFLCLSNIDSADLMRTAHKYKDILEFIKKNISAKIQVSEIAQHYGYSREHLSRSFRKDCGIGLKQYILRELIKRAETMLLDPTLSIKTISENLDFNNEYYFYCFFKKHTKLTPNQYRTKCLSRLKGE